MIRWMRHSSALCRAVWCSITVALFTAAIAVGTTWATFPGRNGDIVFSRSGRIYVMKPNGSEKRQLTFGPAADTFPAYSSSGKRIVFWSHTRDPPQLIWFSRAALSRPGT